MLLMNHRLVNFVDDLPVLLVDYRLVNLTNFFLVNDWLDGFMDDILMMLMHDVLMMFMHHLLMLFMYHILMVLLDDRCVHMCLHAGCLLMCDHLGSFGVFLYFGGSLVMSDDLRLLEGLFDDGLLKSGWQHLHVSREVAWQVLLLR